MIDRIYQKENNLFQSEPWLSFQEKTGRSVIDFPRNEVKGIRIGLYGQKKFIWIQKSPLKIKDLEEMKAVARKEDAVFIRFEPAKISEPEIRKGLVLVTGKSILSGQKSPVATQIMDISAPVEDLLAGMKPKTRYNIRLSAKKGVTVRSSIEKKDVDTLYELLSKTSKRTGGAYSPHPKDYYLKMVETLGPLGMVKVYLAEYGGKALAGILVSRVGEVAIYLHGGFSEEQRNLMAPYLCHFKAIEDLKAEGAKLYDFWGVAENEGDKDPWAGISRFKTGFGGEKVIFPGAYDLVLNKFWYNVLSAAAKGKRRIRR